MDETRVTVFGLGGMGSRIVRLLSEEACPMTLVTVDRKPPDIPGVKHLCSDKIAENQLLKELVDSSDMVILIADLGSKIPTEVAPIIGYLAKKSDVLSLAFLTLPCFFEKSCRIKRADNNVGLLRESVDSILVFSHDRITEIGIRKSLMRCDYDRMDRELARHVSVLAESMLVGAANVDIYLLRKSLQRDAYIGFGSARATEEGQAHKAVCQAISNCLMRNDIRSAKKALIYVKFDFPVSLEEAGRAFGIAESFLRPDAEVFYGWSIDSETDAGELRVLILGSKFAPQDDLFEEVFEF